VKKHEFVDVLAEPGTADLSCDVNFSLLKRAVFEFSHSGLYFTNTKHTLETLDTLNTRNTH
jgi:SAM-dependent MidA family methyltransferase